jgi:zinc protease
MCYLVPGVILAPGIGAQGTPRIQFEKYQLPNGLEVILHEDHSTPIVAVDTWYHVGSGDEQLGRTGFAHLFEHIMFMGSQHVPVGAFDQMLEAAGADNNGSTTEDRTNYYENLPSNALELALWLDADRMGFLLPTMDLAKVNLQRDVVKNERRQRVDNQPYGRADETILAALYPKSHPYSWPVIGSMADLSAASLADVQNFFRTYYAPNNATLTIAGDFNPDTVKKMVARYFGSIPRGPAVQRRTTVPAVNISRDTFLVLEDKVQLPRLFYTWHSVKGFSPDDAALDILAQVIANDKNSRLYKKLVYELQVAQNGISGRFTARRQIPDRCHAQARPENR